MHAAPPSPGCNDPGSGETPAGRIGTSIIVGVRLPVDGLGRASPRLPGHRGRARDASPVGLLVAPSTSQQPQGAQSAAPQRWTYPIETSTPTVPGDEFHQPAESPHGQLSPDRTRAQRRQSRIALGVRQYGERYYRLDASETCGLQVVRIIPHFFSFVNWFFNKRIMILFTINRAHFFRILARVYSVTFTEVENKIIRSILYWNWENENRENENFLFPLNVMNII